VSSGKKILLIIPYFGTWPEYLNLYIQSCYYNKWLNILFLTDNEIPTKYPPNIKFIESSLKQISNLICKKLNILNYELPNSYKLCDFKPTYGLLFQEYLVEYDYWAYGDIDLIYGDLEGKLRNELQNNYDFISLREEILSGSFCLIKNTFYNNHLFKKLVDFNELVTSEQYEGIDETRHNSAIWTGLQKIQLPDSSFTYLISRENDELRIKASFKTHICENLDRRSHIMFENNQLYYQGQTLGYFHYVMNKRKAYFSYPNWEKLPKKFYITDCGFYKSLRVAYLFDPLKKIFNIGAYNLRKTLKYLIKNNQLKKL